MGEGSEGKQHQDRITRAVNLNFVNATCYNSTAVARCECLFASARKTMQSSKCREKNNRWQYVALVGSHAILICIKY
jgi:hypothetical protein